MRLARIPQLLLATLVVSAIVAAAWIIPSSPATKDSVATVEAPSPMAASATETVQAPLAAVSTSTPGTASAAAKPGASPRGNPSTGTVARASAPQSKPSAIKPTIPRSPELRLRQRAVMLSMAERGADRNGDGHPDLPTLAPAQPQAPQVHAPTERLMQAAGSFDGDLRDLPQRPVRQRDRPEREGPQPNPRLFELPGGTVTNPVPPPPVPSAPAPTPSVSFEGASKNGGIGAGWPPDTNGDVGPNHFIEGVNTGIAIYAKTGGAPLVQLSFDDFMSQGAFGNLCDTDNFGDPIILYDTFEDRWILTDFAFQLSGSNIVNPPGMFECFAVSKTGDPVAGGWNFYSINTTGGLGDYPKMGIWPDGIYVSYNMFSYPAGGLFQNVRLHAFNKAQMYAGSSIVQVVEFNLPDSEFSLMPANARLQTGTPPLGSPAYFTSVWNFLNSHSTWKMAINWAKVSLSTLTGPLFSTTNTWGQLTTSQIAVPPGGTALDSLYPRLMMQTQYSNIGGVESLWSSHTVGAATPSSSQAAVRFYQVRVTGGTVEAAAVQSATYSPDVVLRRWMPSVAVNKNGDMAIGYNTSSSAQNPALVYAGRLAADPVNTISLTEQTLVAGTGTQVGISRWGDYATMTLDPDGCTFWFTGEYYQANGSDWRTRIGAFAFPGCTANTLGSLSGTVKNSANTPIPGATVKLGARTAITNGSGVYSFSNLPAGTYPTLMASQQGYVSSTVNSIVISGGGAAVQNLTLTTAIATGCFTDTTQSDFQTDTANLNCDPNSSPGNVVLANGVLQDQTNINITGSGFGFSSTSWVAQTFIAGITGQLEQASVFLFCSGCIGTTPNLTLSIRATDGGGLPTGGDLASATITGFSSGFGDYFTVTFGAPPAVTAGVKYAMVIRAVSNPSNGTYAYVHSGNNQYANGSFITSGNSGSTWSADVTGRDLGFKVFIDPGFAPSGTFISSIKDANAVVGGTATWGNITWNASVPGGTTLQFQVAASNDPNGPFNFVGPDGTANTNFTSGASLAQFNGKRYLRYQAKMTSTGASTPTINDVTICFTTSPKPTLDLNADGSGDALTYQSSSGVWKRQVSQPNGTFVETGAASNLFNWLPGWVVLPAKFDQDNNTDFFLFNPTNGNWYKMLNDGVSGFNAQANGQWWNGWQRFVMDLDGDGITDLFLYDPATGVWFKCLSTPTGFTYLQGGWNPNWEITPMTLNGDAFTDMFLFNRTTGRWFWVYGQAGNSFTYPATGTWFTGWNLYPGDFNADGLSDLLLHDVPTGTWFVSMNNGVGTGFTYTTGQWVTGWTPYVGDLDADGDQDLFLHKASNGQWFELLSNGVGGFTEAGGQQWTTGWQLYPTDFNNDGRTDILLYNPSTGVWYHARNVSPGSFTYTSGIWATNLTIVVRTPFF